MMKVLKTFVAVGNEVHKVDTIEWQGKFWLVPLWVEAKDLGLQRPVRIISLSDLAHQKGGPGADFVLTDPLPKEFFDLAGPSAQEGRFVVVEKPELTMPTQIH